MIGEEFVFFPFLYIKLFELGVGVALNHRSAVTHWGTKLICINCHSGAAALSAPMMLLCCSFASASFTSRNPLSLSVDRLNSKIYTIFRASLIATTFGRLPQKRFTKKDPGSRLYRASWLVLTGIVRFASTSCALSVRSSLLQILRNSSRRHSVLMLLSLSGVTNLTLLFGFCAARMLLQVPSDGWWAVVTDLILVAFITGNSSLEPLIEGLYAQIHVNLRWRVLGRNRTGDRCYHSFAACTVELTVRFIRQTVSALTSGLSCCSAQPTPCWLHLAYFGQKTGCPATAIHMLSYMPRSPVFVPWRCKLASSSSPKAGVSLESSDEIVFLWRHCQRVTTCVLSNSGQA